MTYENAELQEKFNEIKFELHNEKEVNRLRLKLSLAESDLLLLRKNYKELKQHNDNQIQSFAKYIFNIFNGNTAPLLIKITPDKIIPAYTFAIQKWKGTIGEHCITNNDLFSMFAQLKKANKLHVNRHEFTIKKLNFVKSVHNLSIERFSRPRKQITYKQIIYNATDISVEKTESAIQLEENTIISLVEKHNECIKCINLFFKKHNDAIWKKKRPEEYR